MWSVNHILHYKCTLFVVFHCLLPNPQPYPFPPSLFHLCDIKMLSLYWATLSLLSTTPIPPAMLKTLASERGLTAFPYNQKDYPRHLCMYLWHPRTRPSGLGAGLPRPRSGLKWCSLACNIAGHQQYSEKGLRLQEQKHTIFMTKMCS